MYVTGCNVPCAPLQAPFFFLFFFSSSSYLIRNKGHPMFLTTCASLIENNVFFLSPVSVFSLNFRRKKAIFFRPYSCSSVCNRVLAKLLTYNLLLGSLTMPQMPLSENVRELYIFRFNKGIYARG